MKKMYSEPEIEVIRFEGKDIMTTSMGEGDEDD